MYITRCNGAWSIYSDAAEHLCPKKKLQSRTIAFLLFQRSSYIRKCTRMLVPYDYKQLYSLTSRVMWARFHQRDERRVEQALKPKKKDFQSILANNLICFSFRFSTFFFPTLSFCRDILTINYVKTNFANWKKIEFNLQILLTTFLVIVW